MLVCCECALYQRMWQIGCKSLEALAHRLNAPSDTVISRGLRPPCMGTDVVRVFVQKERRKMRPIARNRVASRMWNWAWARWRQALWFLVVATGQIFFILSHGLIFSSANRVLAPRCFFLLCPILLHFDIWAVLGRLHRDSDLESAGQCIIYLCIAWRACQKACVLRLCHTTRERAAHIR